jgi:putative FmdB family regulatory protein
MPIYEYKCDACGHNLEKLQRMSDERLVDCPACGKPALRRLVSAAAFRLKGGGWYETDFKKDNQRNLADGGKKADGATDNAAGSKPAADKPADKAADKPASSTESNKTASSSAPSAAKSGDS